MIKKNSVNIRAIRFRLPKTSKRQVFAVVGAHLMLFSAVSSLPLVEWFTARHYQLDAQTLSLVGEASSKLAHKLTYNKEKALYEYNADEIKSESDDPAAIAERLQRNTTGENADKSTYSLEMATDAANGMTIHDNNSGISFKMTPEFTTMPGRKEQDRLVYPMQDGSKAIYTIKNNGLKEDIVYKSAPRGGEATHAYTLELPDSLEPRIASDGSVGFYSADPLLFGEISFGSDADQVKVESARKNAPKDHLVFAIPAPVIVAADGNIGQAQSKFELTGDTLSVKSTKLDTINGAFSIDPTVVVTSTSDFTAGNNEGNVDFAANEIKRSAYSGAETATWTASTSMSQNRSDAKAVAYNGYMYILGGSVAPGFTVDLNTVIYAPIDPTTGALGAWTESPSVFANARYFHAAAAYNGYLYVSGGRNGAGARYNDIQYSKINTDGSIGAWAASTVLPGNRTGGGLVAMEGFMYYLGGYDGTAYYATAHYAPIKADGTVGAWTATTSFTTGRYNFGVTNYNGYIYVMGGTTAAGSVATVHYAKVKSDGTLEAWQAGTSTLQVITTAPLVALNGYLYTYGGLGTSNGTITSTAYVPINANGSIGNWKEAASTYTTPRVSHVGAAYNGRLYIAGGNSTASYTPNNDSQYVDIRPAGHTKSYTTTTGMPVFTTKGKSYGRSGHTSVVYNGYIYVIGGTQNAVAVATIDYAPINSNGTIGTWAATTAFPTARTDHTSVVYNGYLYVIGGFTGSARLNDVQYAAIGTNGTIGTWAATATFTTARYGHTTAVYNGYAYIMGGFGSAGYLNDVQYALLCTGVVTSGIGGCGATAGTVGTWATTTSFTGIRGSHSSIAFNGYIYVMGGINSSSVLDDAQYALLCTGANSGIGGCGATAGTVGTWTATSNFLSLNPRLAASAVEYNNNIYLIGGKNSGAPISQVVYASFNADGTLGTWQMNSSLISARSAATGATYNGYLYALGGSDATAIERADVEYAEINNGSNGTTGTWATTTAFTNARAGHSSIVANGYLYVMGGTNGTTWYNDVRYAPINANGTLGTWLTTNTFATGREKHGSVVSNGYVYIIGGCTGSSASTASTQFAQLNADGTVGPWASSTALPDIRCDHAAAAYNGNVYVMGGTINGSTAVSGVLRSTINSSTRQLGNWSAVSPLNTVRNADPAAIAHNGYLYIAGGQTLGNLSYSRSVEFAKINADGTLGSWKYTNDLPDRRDGIGMAIVNGRLYVTGGNTGGGNVNITYSAPFVGSDGHLGMWVNSGTLFTSARVRHESVFHNGYLYVIGGFGGAYLSDVQYATVATMPRTATYSRLIDLGSVTTLNSITSNGSGTRVITYRIAASDGIFGAAQTAGSAGGVNARYVSVKAQLDDSDTLVVASATAITNDITVDYGSAGAPACTTAQRLRHGSYYSADVLQPLNSCLP